MFRFPEQMHIGLEPKQWYLSSSWGSYMLMFFITYFCKTRLCFPCPILPSKLHCLFPCWSSNWYTPFLIFSFLLLLSFHLQSQLPLVGNPAPDFEAEAVFDQEFIKVNITYWPEIYDQSYCTFICKEKNLNAFFYCGSCCCCYYHLMSDFKMSLYLSFLSFFLFIIVPLLSGQVYPSYSFTDMEKKNKFYSFVLWKWHSLHLKIGILNLFPLYLCFHLAIHFLNHLIVYNHKVALLVSSSFRKSLNGQEIT